VNTKIRQEIKKRSIGNKTVQADFEARISSLESSRGQDQALHADFESRISSLESCSCSCTYVGDGWCLDQGASTYEYCYKDAINRRSECELAALGIAGSRGYTHTVPPALPTPLAIMDLEDFECATSAPGLDVGFRCRAFIISGSSQYGNHYTFESLGYVQSSEYDDQTKESIKFYDGEELNSPEPIKLHFGRGANSLCTDVPVEIAAGEFIEIAYDGGQHLSVYLPEIIISQESGSPPNELFLWIASDGSTYFDEDLTQVAQLSPPRCYVWMEPGEATQYEDGGNCPEGWLSGSGLLGGSGGSGPVDGVAPAAGLVCYRCS